MGTLPGWHAQIEKCKQICETLLWLLTEQTVTDITFDLNWDFIKTVCAALLVYKSEWVSEWVSELLRLCSDSALVYKSEWVSEWVSWSDSAQTLHSLPQNLRPAQTLHRLCHTIRDKFQETLDSVTAQTQHRLYHTETLRHTLLILNYIRFIDTLLSLSQQYIRVPGSHTCPIFYANDWLLSPQQ